MDPLTMEKVDEVNVVRVNRMLDRIERVVVPDMGVNHYEEPFAVFKKKARDKEYFHTITVCRAIGAYEGYFMRGIKWADLAADVLATIQDVEGAGVTFSPKVQMEFDFELEKEQNEVARATAKEKVAQLQKRNGQPSFPGKWRRTPYEARQYEKLTDYVATTTISEEEGQVLLDQLHTTREGFLGQAYNYDDNDLTEEWMVTFKDGTSDGPSDDDVIRTNLGSLMEVMLLQVQDRVCNETGVLEREPLGLGEKLREAPVWGLDCYTRRMIELAVEDAFPTSESAVVDTEQGAASSSGATMDAGSAADPKVIAVFIERYLLPAINAQSDNTAHNMLFALKHILDEGQAPATVIAYTRAVERAVLDAGIEHFRIHPKGTGVICTAKEGIKPHVMIAEYLGEAYPPYRWCERLDVIDQAQKNLGIKPTLPDFWNILLERPHSAARDSRGYGLIYVDASQKANLGSSCSHSCDSNTTSAVVARNGKLAIALTTNRMVHYGEELTMDYSSITTSDVEWRAAICLCGKTQCRGSFLHYATQDDLQQVLTQNCGTLWRYASLLKACSARPASSSDVSTTEKHGMLDVAMGASPAQWAIKYAADNLRFVEFERKALPCALMRSKNGKTSGYTFSAADMDARSVMEQRLQSLVCCFSMTGRVFPNQPVEKQDMMPLRPLAPSEAVEGVWHIMATLPHLLNRFVLEPHSGLKAMKAVVKTEVKSEIKSLPSLTAKATLCAGDGLPQLEGPMELRDRIKTAIASVEAVLAEPTPASLRFVRTAVLRMRAAIETLKDLSTPDVRIQLLCDMLVLWANTTHFSGVNMLDPVKSGPIDVIAQDIGSAVRRSDLAKKDGKAGAKKPTASATTSATAKSAATAAAAAPPPSAAAAAAVVVVKTEVAVSEDESPRDVSATAGFDAASSGNGNGNGNGSCSESSSLTATTVSMDIELVTQRGAAVAASAAMKEASTVSANANPNLAIVPALEVVYTGSKTYEPLFTFHTLMNWFDAGTDIPIVAPDVFGCCMLPQPSQCFGPCAAQHGYTHKQRTLLLKMIGDEKLQSKPWAESLKACFGPVDDFHGYCSPLPDSESKREKSRGGGSKAGSAVRVTDKPIGPSPLFGSPMLDVALGQVQAIAPVQLALLGRVVRRTKKSINADDSDDDAGGIQFDSILPPEIPTDWVQCDSAACRKWRRVAWHVDMDALPDAWQCSMNTWEPADASCDVPQDSYDPEAENTIELGGSEKAPPLTAADVGQWRDILCQTNRVYYEAKLMQFRPNKKSGVAEMKTHFKGWNVKFDEWLPCNSDRIRPHNLITDPCCKDIRHQAEWQGNFKLHKNEGGGSGSGSSDHKDGSENRKNSRGGGGKDRARKATKMSEASRAAQEREDEASRQLANHKSKAKRGAPKDRSAVFECMPTGSKARKTTDAASPASTAEAAVEVEGTAEGAMAGPSPELVLGGLDRSIAASIEIM